MFPCSCQLSVRTIFTIRMPRKNPLPKKEVEICERLRWFRKKTGYSQVFFSKEAGLDSSMLASYEHSRSPLKYAVAWRIQNAFGLNFEWLATGKDDPAGTYFWPSPSDLKLDEAALFSDGYKRAEKDFYQSPAFRELMKAKTLRGGGGVFFQPTLEGRTVAIRWAQGWIQEWFERVPVEHINEFLNDLEFRANELLDKYPPEPPEVLKVRRAELKSTLVAKDVRLRLWKRIEK